MADQPEDAKNPKPPEIRELVWRILKNRESRFRKTQIRLVIWIVGGKPYGPYIEKRDLLPGGEHGKCRGLNVEDLKFLVYNSADLVDCMEKRIRPEEMKIEAVPQEEKKVKLWVDELRNAPDHTWEVAKTNTEAIKILAKGNVKEVSLDHDIAEKGLDGNWFYTKETFEPTAHYISLMPKDEAPRFITLHTANADGARAFRSILAGLQDRILRDAAPSVDLESLNKIVDKEKES